MKKSRPRTLKLNTPYYVLWLDACFSWDKPEEACSPCKMLGWYVGEDASGLIFAMEIEGVGDGAETSRFHMSVPHGMVVEIKELAL